MLPLSQTRLFSANKMKPQPTLGAAAVFVLTDANVRVVEIAGYLAGKLETLRPAEASVARVLRDLVRNQRM